MLHIEAKSKELTKIKDALKKNIYKKSQGKFRPHVTIAFVNNADKYVNSDTFMGASFYASELLITTQYGNTITYPLK